MKRFWQLSIPLWLFSFFSLKEMPLILVSFASLALAAFYISKSLKDHPGLLKEKLASIANRKILIATLLAVSVVVFMGIIYRTESGLSLFPRSLKAFVLVSVAIGAMEEIVFRGVVQGVLEGKNRTRAILLAAVSHSIYKCLLMMSMGVPDFLSLLRLFGFTLLIGIVFGRSKTYSNSLWPCILAHMAFDVMAYSELPVAPAWVW